MLSDSEINKLIDTLFNLRKDLLWVISQKPVNDEQKEWIEKGKKNLYDVNKLLEEFSVRLPS